MGYYTQQILEIYRSLENNLVHNTLLIFMSFFLVNRLGLNYQHYQRKSNYNLVIKIEYQQMSHYLILALLTGLSLLLLIMPENDSSYIFSYKQPLSPSPSPSSSSFENIVHKYEANHSNLYKCDFLNLCNQENNISLNGISHSFSKGIVDISYLKIDIDLPFPQMLTTSVYYDYNLLRISGLVFFSMSIKCSNLSIG